MSLFLRHLHPVSLCSVDLVFPFMFAVDNRTHKCSVVFWSGGVSSLKIVDCICVWCSRHAEVYMTHKRKWSECLVCTAGALFRGRFWWSEALFRAGSGGQTLCLGAGSGGQRLCLGAGSGGQTLCLGAGSGGLD